MIFKFAVLKVSLKNGTIVTSTCNPIPTSRDNNNNLLLNEFLLKIELFIFLIPKLWNNCDNAKVEKANVSAFINIASLLFNKYKTCSLLTKRLLFNK